MSLIGLQLSLQKNSGGEVNMKRFSSGTAAYYDAPLWSFGRDDVGSTRNEDWYNFNDQRPIMLSPAPVVTEVSLDLESEKIKANVGNTFRHTDRGYTFKLFNSIYKLSPEEGLSFLKGLIVSGHVDRDDSVEWTFPLLVSARGDVFDSLYKFMVKVEKPENILNFSLKKYREGWGESYLQLAVSILSDMGNPALACMKNLIQSLQGESEFFIITLLSHNSITIEEKRTLIERIILNPFTGSRIALVEYLKHAELPYRNDVLRRLTHDLDSEVAEYAQEALS